MAVSESATVKCTYSGGSENAGVKLPIVAIPKSVVLGLL